MPSPDRYSYDPAWLENGRHGTAAATHDRYFAGGPGALALVLNAVVNQLPEPQRSAVQMVAMQGMTLQDAADHLEAEVGKPVGARQDRKAVWRWVEQGLREVRARLEGSPWIDVLLEGRVLLDVADVGGRLRRSADHDDGTETKEP